MKDKAVNRKTLFWSRLTSFADIAWVDPFNPIKPEPPKKSEKKNKAQEKKEREANMKAVQKMMAGLDRKANYLSMAVPSVNMFLKIFRACLGCETVEQLWVYEIN